MVDRSIDHTKSLHRSPSSAETIECSRKGRECRKRPEKKKITVVRWTRSVTFLAQVPLDELCQKGQLELV